jgi:AAA domain
MDTNTNEPTTQRRRDNTLAMGRIHSQRLQNLLHWPLEERQNNSSQVPTKSMDGNETAFCGLPVAAGRVLVVSEETKRLWAGRRDEVGLADHVQLIALPFRGRPLLEEWQAFMVRLEQLQVAEKYDLIVFDSMHNLWGVTDENKNAEVLAYLTPLNWLTEQGAALLLIAHPSKGDAGEGRATRGGGAWGGFVDLILEMRRHDAENRDDTRRVLTAYSRWEDTPGELVIELDKDKGEYTIIGTKADARAHDRMSIYVDLLPKDEPGKTPEEIREAWLQDDIPRPGVRTITRDLDQAAIEGKVRCSGEGVKGKPKRYSILDT